MSILSLLYIVRARYVFCFFYTETLIICSPYSLFEGCFYLFLILNYKYFYIFLVHFRFFLLLNQTNFFYISLFFTIPLI